MAAMCSGVRPSADLTLGLPLLSNNTATMSTALGPPDEGIVKTANLPIILQSTYNGTEVLKKV